MKRSRRKIRKLAVRFLISLAAVVCLVLIMIFAGKGSASASESCETYYKSICVESGDTLSGIAAEYGVSVKELKEINNINSDTITAGEYLIVAYSK